MKNETKIHLMYGKLNLCESLWECLSKIAHSVCVCVCVLHIFEKEFRLHRFQSVGPKMCERVYVYVLVYGILM